MGVPTAGYVGREHQVQRQVRAAVEAVIGEPLTEDKCGTDGCSIPTFAAPLRAFAFGFARMATGKGLSADYAAAARRLFDAATRHPHLVAGTGHPDTLIMQAFGGRVMQKIGAEGVQCGAIRDKGWGYAIKCDDGNMAASQAMLAGLLLADRRAGREPAQGAGEIRQPDRAQRAWSGGWGVAGDGGCAGLGSLRFQHFWRVSHESVEMTEIYVYFLVSTLFGEIGENC